MNQGAVRSSPVQQIVAAGSPNWWNITRPPPNHSFMATSQPQNLLPHDELTQPLFDSSSWNEYSHAMPESLSQLLMGGLVSDEEKCNMMMQQGKHWEHNLLNQTSNENEFQGLKPNWTQYHQIDATLSAGNKQDLSSNECNSIGTGGPVTKKPKIQPSPPQSTFKVRKEKLGDRVTALHQLVSPFGKTDTASVLLEAIGYIRFLQSQVEALSLPYLGCDSRNTTHHHQVQGERNCLFPDDPGQLVNDKGLKRKSLSEKECQEAAKKDLRSRGLCLVPVSCTLHVGSDNGADYWAPAFPGNF